MKRVSIPAPVVPVEQTATTNLWRPVETDEDGDAWSTCNAL
jgi:hypothetical protein